jgi:methylmalonyl-CoA mutase C-terminal domain/subunit
MEVIYTGLHRSIEDIVKTALEEDADVIGMSIYSGAHLPLGKKLMDQLKDKGIADRLVLIGGNVPQRDVKALKDFGVSGVFPTGARLEEIVKFIRENIKE